MLLAGCMCILAACAIVAGAMCCSVDDIGDVIASEGLAGVFLEHRARLLAFLKARGAGDAADDLLQELWFKAIRVEGAVEPSPLSYLYRMADRLLITNWRTTARRTRRDGDWIGAQQDADAATAELRLIARETLDLAIRRLRQLGQRVEHVVRRFRLDGLSQREIADELGVSLSTVEKDLRKGYAALIAVRSSVDED
jgi:RNA polymerase sigma factor (sigma-70 family)